MSRSKLVIFPHVEMLTPDGLYLEGQVLALRGYQYQFKPKEKVYKNLFRIMRYYLPRKRVPELIGISSDHFRVDASPDKFGHYQYKFEINKNQMKNLEYHTLQGEELVRPEFLDNEPLVGVGVKRCVISDIDDTILVSDIRKSWKRLRKILFKNSLKRQAVPNMPEAYRMLNDHGYQFFYLSSSQTVLYPILQSFIKFQMFPPGPLFLKKFKGWWSLFFKGDDSLRINYKFNRAKFLFESLPKSKFILIGDSGQHDTGIYFELAKEFPDRVEAIFIRFLPSYPYSDFETIKEELKLKGIPIYLFEDGNDLKQWIKFLIEK